MSDPRPDTEFSALSLVFRGLIEAPIPARKGRAVWKTATSFHTARPLRAGIGASMRPRKTSDSAENSVSGRGSDIDADAVSFPVIHGPMRAAPLWHAWIGRWVTGLAITTSAHHDPLTALFSAWLGVSPRRIEASARRRIRDQVLDHSASLGSLQFIGSFQAKAHSCGRSHLPVATPRSARLPAFSTWAALGQVDLLVRERQLSGNLRRRRVRLHPAITGSTPAEFLTSGTAGLRV